MKIRKDLIGSTIIHKGSKFFVEDTPAFIKIAKAYGFDFFEKKKSKKKADKVEDTDADIS